VGESTLEARLREAALAALGEGGEGEVPLAARLPSRTDRAVEVGLVDVGTRDEAEAL
jgi:hypothetical protein